MPTPYESALMCVLSDEYQGNPKKIRALLEIFKTQESFSSASNKNKFVNYLKDKGWKILGAETGDELDEYQCLVFFNKSEKEIVLAHKGSVLEESKGSVSNYADVIEIFKGREGEIPKILHSALIYLIKIVRKRDDKYKDFTIHQTGFSLGGCIAEILAAYLAKPSFVFPKHSSDPRREQDTPLHPPRDQLHEQVTRLHRPRETDANANTFYSLGGGYMADKIGSLPADLKNVKNYLPLPSIANTASPHLGIRRLLQKSDGQFITTENSLELNWDTATPLQVPSEFFRTMQSDFLNNLLPAFDEVTGEVNFKQVTEWPEAINTFEQVDSPKISRDEINSFDTVYTAANSMVGFTHIRKGSLKFAEAPTLRDNDPQINLAPA